MVTYVKSKYLSYPIIIWVITNRDLESIKFAKITLGNLSLASWLVKK